MDRAKKKLASALDGLRSLHTKAELEFDEKVRPEHVCLSRIVRHGFPDDPRCIAYDSVQRLLAIGAGRGSVRIFGDLGVDYHLKHESEAPVLHLQFLVNEGALVTACRDDMVHLWNFRQKIPEIVHSVQLNKEQVTCISLPFQSKWLHVGTERGNVYFVCVATFILSTYIINWNKAIDLSCRSHPGSVKSILTCPTDPSRLLILYDKGIVVLWNLFTKEVDRFISDYPVRSVNWHHDGRQFICGNSDGSLIIWNVKKPKEFVQRMTPHGQKCRPITQVDWRHSPDGESLVIFSGGMPQEEGVLPALTISRASRSATVLEMDHPLVAFTPLTSSPYASVSQLPFAVAVLLKNDLLIIDLNSPGYPCFENLNPMDIHESPVTFVKYFSDCPVDLIGALTLVGCKQRRQGFSDKPWPITGGTSRECATGHQELLLTGHEDGSLKFWQASGEHLQILYKLKTGRHFERCAGSEPREISHAVAGIELCLDSRLLLIAGCSGQATLFRFVKNESANEITVVHIPSLNECNTNCADDEVSCSSGSVKELRRQGKAVSQESHSSETSEGSTADEYLPLKVRGGALRRPAGYQPEMVCLIPWKNPSQPERITSMALNSAYGVVAIGTASGLALVDITQYTLIYSWSSSELYGREATPFVLLGQNSETSPSEYPLTPTLPNSPIRANHFTRRPSSIAGSLFLRRNYSDLADSSHHASKNSTAGHDFFVAHRQDSLESTQSATSDCLESNPACLGSYHEKTRRQRLAQQRLLDGHGKRAATNAYSEFPKHTECVREKYSLEDISKFSREFRPVADSCSDAERNSEVSTVHEGTVSSCKHLQNSPPDNETLKSYDEESSHPAVRSQSTRVSNLMRRLTNRGRGLVRSISVQLSDVGDHTAAFGGDVAKDPGSQQNSKAEQKEGSLARHESRSPSQTSDEKVLLSESVTTLCFINSCSKKNDLRAGPCLWLGTSTGACIAFSLLLPPDRLTSTVVVAPSGTVLRLRGQLLYLSFLDQSFCIISAATESFRDVKDNETKSTTNVGTGERPILNKVVTKASLSPTFSNASEYSKDDDMFQIVVLISEEEVRVIALPSFNPLFSHRPDIPFVIARSTHVRGHPVLMLLNAAGQIIVLSLPTLRPLICAPLFRQSLDLDDSICQKTSFSEHGLAMYSVTPSEIQKFTVCSELAAQVQECMGELFLPVDMPEPPKSSFLKGVSTLFASSQKESVDLDAIFVDKTPGAVMGNSMRSVAKTIPGPSTSLDQASSRSITAGQAVGLALQSLHERSEKLNTTVDATERLRDNAMSLSQRTGKLVEKYEKKKWYNF